MLYKLPDLHARWPFPPLVNPSYDAAAPRSEAWIASLDLFSESEMRRFREINPGLLAAMAYPHHNEEQLECASDLMSMLFAFD